MKDDGSIESLSVITFDCIEEEDGSLVTYQTIVERQLEEER